MANKTKTQKKSFFDNAFCHFFKNGWQKFAKTKFGQKTTAHFTKQGYLYFSFFVPALLFFMVFILQGTYPFGRGSVLVLDLNGQYVYFFEALRKAIYGDASLLYSFTGTLGGEFIGLYGYYLASPLSYIVALFPEGAMTESLLILELLKCGLCGLTMAYYLKKTRPRANEMITISVAIMYALCAFAIVMAHNTMWIDALIWLPLLTLGIERLVHYGSFKLFTVSLAITAISNFYIGYMVCFYVLFYFFYYYFFASYRESTAVTAVEEGDNNFIGEKRHFLRSLLRIGLASAIALLIAAFLILPTYYSLTLGKTTFSDPAWKYVLWGPEGAEKLFFKFTPFDFISKLFIASFDTVNTTGLPYLYCGMFTLILVPVYFISKRVNRRQKIGAALILATFFLLMIIAPADMLMHGAQEPNWLNYRYSFMFSFLLLVFAHRALELLHTVNFKKTAIVASVWGALVLITAPFIYEMFQKPEVSFARRLILYLLLPIALLAIYEAAHYYLLKERKNTVARSAMMTTLAIIICLEMFVGTLLNTTSLNEDVTFSPKYTNDQGTGLEGYDNFMDTFRAVTTAIQASDSSFYRMEKTHGKYSVRKYADNHALGMRGLTGSTSTLNERSITFLHRLGYISYSNISSHKGDTSVADTLLAIKYLIIETPNESDNYYLNPYNVMKDENGAATNKYHYKNGPYDKYLYTFENKHTLSIAYAANANIKAYNITKEASPFTTMNDLVSTLLGENVTIFKNIAIKDSDIKLSENIDRNELYKTFVIKDRDSEGNLIPKTDASGNQLYDKDGNPEYVTKSRYYYNFERVGNGEGDMIITITFKTPDDLKDSTEILFKLPTDYPREAKWEFTTDREGAETIKDTVFHSGDKTDCILSLGNMNAGETGTLKITVEGTNFYFERPEENGIFYYVDETAYTDAMTRLAKGNFTIDSYTESSFEGKITMPEGMSSVFTSIPYEEYWNVYVDGKQVDTYMNCAALLGFDIEGEGEHTVELRYESKALYTGIKLSIVGVVLFAAWIVVDSVFLRKKRLADCTLDYDCYSEGDYQNDSFDEELEAEIKRARRREKKRKGK